MSNWLVHHGKGFWPELLGVFWPKFKIHAQDDYNDLDSQPDPDSVNLKNRTRRDNSLQR